MLADLADARIPARVASQAMLNCQDSFCGIYISPQAFFFHSDCLLCSLRPFFGNMPVGSRKRLV